MARKSSGRALKPRRITARQKAARRLNIAIARKHRKKSNKKGKWGGKKVSGTKGRFEQVGKFVVDHKKRRILTPKGDWM